MKFEKVNLVGSFISCITGTLGVFLLFLIDYFAEAHQEIIDDDIARAEVQTTALGVFILFFLFFLFILLLQFVLIAPILKNRHDQGRLRKKFIMLFAVVLILIFASLTTAILAVPAFGLPDFLKTCLISISFWSFYFIPNFITFYYFAVKRLNKIINHA